MKKMEILEGSMAVALAVKACKPGVISAYPISPQTHIVEALAKMVADGELNSQYVLSDSEFSSFTGPVQREFEVTRPHLPRVCSS